MLYHGGVQRAALLGNVGEIHQRLVGQTQGQVQVAQAYVTVQTQYAPAS